MKEQINTGELTEMSEEAKAFKREYFRKWRENNKDKVKRNNASYWERKKNESKQNEVTTTMKEQINTGELTEMSEEAKAFKREYFRKWRENNKDKVKRNNASYWERKKDKNKQNEVTT